MPSRSDDPSVVGDSQSARPNREGIKERVPLDGRLLPCAAGVWAASGVVVWFRLGTSEATNSHDDGGFISWWLGHPVSAVVVCDALAAATVIAARWYMNRRRRSYGGDGIKGGVRRSWVLQLLMMVVGAIIGGVRSIYAIRRSSSHWLAHKQGGHLLIDPSMDCTATSYPRRLPEAPFAPGQERYGISVSLKGMPSDIFLSGGADLRTVNPGQRLEGLVSVKEAFQPGTAPITLSSAGHSGSGQGLHVVQAPPSSPMGWGVGRLWNVVCHAMSAVHREFLEASRRYVPEDLQGLAQGMVIGDTSLQSDDDKAAFVTSGLSHLSAVSGANVAIVLGVVAAIVSTERPRVRYLCAGCSLVGFVLLIGLDASVLRAAVAGTVGLLATMAGRRRQALPALCAGIIGLVVWNPDMAVSLGFALSCAATAGIICLAPPLSDVIEKVVVRVLTACGKSGEVSRRTRAVITGCAVCVAADVVTQPIILLVIGRTSALSIVANSLVGFVVAPVTVIGTIALVLCAFSVVAHPVGIGAGTVCEAVQWLSESFCRGATWLASAGMAACTPVLWWIRWVGHAIAKCEAAQLVVGSPGSAIIVIAVVVGSCFLLSTLWSGRFQRWMTSRRITSWWGKALGSAAVVVIAISTCLAATGGGTAGERDRSGEFSEGVGPTDGGSSNQASEYALRPPRDAFDHLRAMTHLVRSPSFPPAQWTVAVCPFSPAISVVMWPDSHYALADVDKQPPIPPDDVAPEVASRLQQRIKDCAHELKLSSHNLVADDASRRADGESIAFVGDKKQIDPESSSARWFIITTPTSPSPSSHSGTGNQSFRPTQLANGTPVTTLVDEGIVVLRSNGQTCSWRFCP
ncbi:ComEC/Rec2 family competence protein [Corynebacterium sp.]|uniref:ComEC/Rec2 family competence protein n=1 Tax=Corynebacterium sp. TaxID=1720 RepID=UPI0026DCD823|nr:ComEC/Rec2 family competence protein [Corynebacterium sp.]MDO4915674.1 ComEC/Rec2 family competence protein [Corynebacterium sp.]